MRAAMNFMVKALETVTIPIIINIIVVLIFDGIMRTDHR
jgi:hypothetical protein